VTSVRQTETDYGGTGRG